jgi:hypothetical protein
MIISELRRYLEWRNPLIVNGHLFFGLAFPRGNTAQIRAVNFPF